MANDYEGFKKNVYALTSIDLNSYKERQMKMDSSDLMVYLQQEEVFLRLKLHSISMLMVS